MSSSEVANTSSYNMDQAVRLLRTAVRKIKEEGLTNLVPILPLMLRLEGKPYTLKDRFMFSPLFNLKIPQSLVIKAGRQVSKTTSIAAQGVIYAAIHPFFKILYVAPLKVMIERLSAAYINPFVETSPLRHVLFCGSRSGSIYRKVFRNGSIMHFGYAYLRPTQIRGISADMLFLDEIADLDPDHVPVIQSTTDASTWAVTEYAGTPRTTDNFMEYVWEQSSGAEWFIKCKSCGFWNIPSLDYHITKMISEDWENVSKENPGVICAECQKPINPREGQWVHRYPNRKADFAGYHIPQIIVPIHYENPRKWKILVRRMKSDPFPIFANEILGESYDAGQRLVTKQDLIQAAILHENRIDLARQKRKNYVRLVISVDWGGRGDKMLSTTAVAVMGLLPNGTIDVIYGERLPLTNTHKEDADRVLMLYHLFNPDRIVHDFNGLGMANETFLVQSGIPMNKIVAISYERSGGPIIRYHRSKFMRGHYRVDKARSLLVTCLAIKEKKIRFFKFDYVDRDQPGLICDFLALVEDKAERRISANEVYLITKDPKMIDDFAQAVNMGAVVLWQLGRCWPNFAAYYNQQHQQEEVEV